MKQAERREFPSFLQFACFPLQTSWQNLTQNLPFTDQLAKECDLQSASTIILKQRVDGWIGDEHQLLNNQCSTLSKTQIISPPQLGNIQWLLNAYRDSSDSSHSGHKLHFWLFLQCSLSSLISVLTPPPNFQSPLHHALCSAVLDSFSWNI